MERYLIGQGFAEIAVNGNEVEVADAHPELGEHLAGRPALGPDEAGFLIFENDPGGDGAFDDDGVVTVEVRFERRRHHILGKKGDPRFAQHGANRGLVGVDRQDARAVDDLNRSRSSSMIPKG